MNSPISPLKFRLLAIALIVVSSSIGLRAQQTWTGTSGTGGDGTWDAGHTPDWDGGNVWTGGDDQAIFTNTPGTIAVDNSFGNVVTDQMYFSAPAGNYVFTGGVITTPSNSDYPVYADTGNAANVTINNDFNLNQNPSNNGQHFENYGSGIVTLNGNITENGITGGGPQQIYFDAGNAGANGAGELVINGKVSVTNGVAAEADFGFGGGAANAVYVFGAKADFSGISNGINIANGTILVDTPNLTSQVTMEYGAPSLLTNGAITYSSGIVVRGPGANTLATVGGNTADISTFSGSILVYDDQNLTVSAAAGGRVYFTGSITGAIPTGLGKTGTGTVVLGNSAGLWQGTNGGVEANLQAGTTLINGTSAFGGNAGTVNLAANATLGGSGSVSSSQTVVANAVTVGTTVTTAIIMAGDPGQANLGIAPSISTLHLLGGLAATNGLTLDFKLTGDFDSPEFGVDNDYIDLGTSGAFTLGGPVTVNFTTLDTIETGTPYILMGGNGTWTEADGTTFNFTAPTGYALDMTYGTDGYFFDTTADQFSVKFVAVPEPSIYGLLGLGLLALVAFGKFRKLTV
jgi:hypothetical protein